MIPFVAFSLRRAWQGFWRNALMSIAATLTMVLMLLLLAGFFVAPERAARRASTFVEQKVEVVAYIQNNATPDQVDTLVASGRRDARGGLGRVRVARRGARPVQGGAGGQGRHGPHGRPSTRTRSTRASNVKLRSPTDLRRRHEPPCATTRSSATCSTSRPWSTA